MKISKQVIEDILLTAKQVYPNEFVAILKEISGVISELHIIPGSSFSRTMSSYRHDMMAIDVGYVGTVHSHPIPDYAPSQGDLNSFSSFGKIHIISKFPFESTEDLAAYSREGKKILLEIVEPKLKVAVLFSGGKDSTMALAWALKNHDVKYLVTAIPSNKESFLFHTSNVELTELQAEAIGIKLVKVKIKSFRDTEEAEELKNETEKLKIDALVCGGVHSSYQKNIFGKIASELGMQLIVPYWDTSHEKLIEEAISQGFEILITSVSAEGLTKEFLGKKLDSAMLETLKNISRKTGIDIGGEGGEYCTFVVDGPIFKKRIEILHSETKWQKNSGKFIIKKAKLIEKD